MIVLHFCPYVSRISAVQRGAERGNRGGGRECEDKPPAGTDETTVDESRKDDRLIHNSDCVCKKIVPRCSFWQMSLTNQPSWPPSFGSPQYIPHSFLCLVSHHTLDPETGTTHSSPDSFNVNLCRFKASTTICHILCLYYINNLKRTVLYGDLWGRADGWKWFVFTIK